MQIAKERCTPFLTLFLHKSYATLTQAIIAYRASSASGVACSPPSPCRRSGSHPCRSSPCP
eukprot:6047271-Heterocapsa_arctica.AAC.1